MLIGTHSHGIDAKGRMFLPAKMRYEFGDTVYLVKGIDPCITVYPIQAWNEFYAKLDGLPQIEARKIKRFLFASAVETPIDSQGRVLIAPELREYAGLGKNVKLIGMGKTAEIWSEENYGSEMESMQVDDIANKLIELGF
ncbi:MAG: division/cell wall cluster transcriptional repressor MraZ [Ruminococcaceae bacterium]|nr:division/cell wall cluster transcriptional repressor MraZ [Oscillospiraceae bacterium]